MTVYVDDMRARFGRLIMCHMIADIDDELHRMADAIGVKRKWFQGDHYDIALSKRALAISRGAREITWEQLSFMTTLREFGEPMPKPEDAERAFFQSVSQEAP
jgi:hypothetical protein